MIVSVNVIAVRSSMEDCELLLSCVVIEAPHVFGFQAEKQEKFENE